MPVVSTWAEIEDAAEPILQEAMYGSLPADEVPARLRDATDAIFARAEP